MESANSVWREEPEKAESGRSTPGTRVKNQSNIIRQVNEWKTHNEAVIADSVVSSLESFLSSFVLV